eukprot:CAMPEP_0195514844 /NCGR_PEP_ID=MMETSP0794_2-20130614/6112_1 /TAXON_ID=515487 /ORGANISM="Stephanopyxis turris, Strain CCMP 815" /LENGTH=192 /DNA_ID=CAMNT_0040643173 /DNA_START=115 /DNA_END=694 /DNA_ORIENTATION=+
MTPVAAYYYYYAKNKKSDEEMREILTKSPSYTKQITERKAQRKDMVKFLDKIRSTDENSAEVERNLSEVLRAGKSEQKRKHAVDRGFYGSKEGAEMQLKAMADKQNEERERRERKKEEKRLKAAAKNEKKQKKKKKKKKQAAVEEQQHDTDITETAPMEPITNSKPQVAAAIGTVAAAAVAIGALFIGRPRS